MGARPQFIKACTVSAALKEEGVEEVLVHTGQHYDFEMSEVFFRTMGLKEPDHYLGIGSSSHGAQTGRMLESIEKVLEVVRPSAVVVYGDTNSTLAGALAAAKLKIQVVHIESGLRSFNRDMPEEINRVMTDHLSSILFAPTSQAVKNLRAEGITARVVRTGDIMYDTCLLFRKEYEKAAPSILGSLGLEGRNFGLITVHREDNTDLEENWESIVGAAKAIAGSVLPLVWPVHPRVREKLGACGAGSLILTKPLPYLEMQALLSRASIVLTDSGGLQKEAYFHRVPCVTLRRETEWTELVGAGVNKLAGPDLSKIIRSARGMLSARPVFKKNIYGDGTASKRIAGEIRSRYEKE